MAGPRAEKNGHFFQNTICIWRHPPTLGLSVFDFICQPKVFDAFVFANNPEAIWLFVGCAKANKASIRIALIVQVFG